VTRRARGLAQTALGRIELTISSELERGVVIPGLISCMVPEDCPPGSECLMDLTCSQ
jgi:hypothetical protein